MALCIAIYSCIFVLACLPKVIQSYRGAVDKVYLFYSMFYYAGSLPGIHFKGYKLSETQLLVVVGRATYYKYIYRNTIE